MKLICTNKTCNVYDDGKNYVLEKKDKSDKAVISKDKYLAYPISFISKYDFEIVDEEYIKELAAKLLKKSKRNKKK